MHIVTFHVRTLKRIDQFLELTESALEHNINMICVPEHRFHNCELEIKYHHTGNWWMFISASAWRNSVNATLVGVGMLLSPHARKSLYSIEKIQPRIIVATLTATTAQRSSATVNASNEKDIDTFYNELSSLVLSFPKQRSHHRSCAAKLLIPNILLQWWH